MEREEVDVEKLFLDGVRNGIIEGIKQKFSQSYNNPLEPWMNRAIEAHGDTFKQLFADAVDSAIGDPAFVELVHREVRSKLAKTLVAQFGGTIEKQVNVLKSDPATRARITLAIEEVVRATGKSA